MNSARSLESLKMRNFSAHTTKLGVYYLQVFEAYLNFFEPEKAIYYGKKALDQFKREEDYMNQLYVLEKLGDLYDQYCNYQKSIECYSDCKELGAILSKAI